jgi:hypothetical protein
VGGCLGLKTSQNITKRQEIASGFEKKKRPQKSTFLAYFWPPAPLPAGLQAPKPHHRAVEGYKRLKTAQNRVKIAPNVEKSDWETKKTHLKNRSF